MQEELISDPQTEEKLRFSTKLAYGAGDLGAAITTNILVFFLLYFFTNVAGLSAAWASSVLAIAKISDAINDPIIGIWSDRTRTRWGRRIPWILGGAVPFAILFFLQWLVPPLNNNWLLFTYYVIIAVFFNLAYTAVNLPYTALTPELTQDYNERTSLNSFRMAFSIGGSIFSLILAQIILQVYPDEPYKAYWTLGLICALIAMVSNLWCAIRIQERGASPLLSLSQRKQAGRILFFITGIGFLVGVGGLLTTTLPFIFCVTAIILSILLATTAFTLVSSSPEPHLVNEEATRTRSLSHAVPNIPFKEQFKIVLQTKPFLFVIGIYLCSWLGVQLIASILIYYVVSWMGLPQANFPLVAVAIQGTALVMLFVWQKISDRIGKKQVFCIGMIFWIIALMLLWTVQPGQVVLMYLCCVLAGCGVSVAYLIPWSMVPDVIEFDELQTGQRREGIFYGFMVLLQKMGLAFALFLVGQALDKAGFIERPPGGDIPTMQPESALFAIRFAISPLPMFFLVIGIILAYFYPITKELHEDIRTQLANRKRD